MITKFVLEATASIVVFVEAALEGGSIYYEYDLTKPRQMLGLASRYDNLLVIDDALTFREGNDIGVLSTG